MQVNHETMTREEESESFRDLLEKRVDSAIVHKRMEKPSSKEVAQKAREILDRLKTDDPDRIIGWQSSKQCVGCRFYRLVSREKDGVLEGVCKYWGLNISVLKKDAGGLDQGINWAHEHYCQKWERWNGVLSEESKDKIKEFAECYAEDICIGNAPDLYDKPVHTSGFAQQVGPSVIFEESLPTVYPQRRDAGEWRGEDKRCKGDIVTWRGSKWICDTDFHFDTDEQYIPPSKSTHWEMIQPSPIRQTSAERPNPGEFAGIFDRNEIRNRVSPGCKECTRRLPNCACMVAKYNIEDHHEDNNRYLTPEKCKSFTTDELLTCRNCDWHGKKIWKKGDPKEEHWSHHCFKTGIFMGSDPEEGSPILNRSQCPYYGWTKLEYYRETPPQAYKGTER